MNLFTLTGEILLRGTDEARQELGGVSSKGEEAESRLSKAFKKIGGVVAAAFAVDKIKDFGVSIVNAASEVGAEMSAFEQIMGDYSDNAQAKLNEVADSTGVVSTRLTPYMTSLTAKFKGLGNDIDTSTDLAQRGLFLASDAAAFWDKSLDDSMSALNSFINGSYEGGEAIGLFANDTQLAQFAIKQGVVESTKDWSALDEATKQATRLEYAEAMMKQSGATGQAAKESGQYANVQANLAETWRQFKAEIGEPLLQNVVIPAMNALQGVVGTLSDKWKQLNKWVSDNKDTIDKWVDALIIAGTMIGAYVLAVGTMSILTKLKTWITSVATAQKLLNLVMSLNPIGLVVMAIAGLVVAFVTLWNKSEAFRNFWKGLWAKIWKEVEPVVKDIKTIFTQLWTGIKAVWNAVSPYFKQLWNGILKNAKAFIAPIASTFKLAWSNIKVVWNVVVAYFKTIWNNIKAVFSVVASVLTGDFRGAWNGIKSIWSNTASFFRTVWNGIKQIFSNVGTWFKDIFNDAKNAIKRVFVDFPSEMGDIGKNLVKGLWNGISDMTSWIVDKVKGFGGTVLNGIKNFFGIHSPSTVFAEIAKFLMEGFGIGIEDNADMAVDAVEGTGEEVTSGFQGIMDRLQNWFSSNPILRRIGEAFGFEFADAVESTEETVEDVGTELGETTAAAIEEGTSENLTTKPVETWAEKVLRLTASTAEGQRVALKNELDQLNALYEEGVEAGEDLNSSYMVMLSQQIAETETKLKAFETTEKTLAQKIKDFFTGTFQEVAKNIEGLTSKVMGYVTGITGAMADLQNQRLENEISAKEKELSEEEDRKKKSLEMLEEEKEQGLITKEEYSKRQKAIDEDYKDFEAKNRAERQAIEKRQFEAKKKNDIANIWINMATATMRAFAENIWPVALGITAALGVQAGLQTATIESQQYTPAFAKGGIVDDATYGLVGEDGREAIIPLERNTEWVGGLAKAISPAVAASSQSGNEEVRGLREEIVGLRRMLSEYLTQLLAKDTDVVINGESLAYAIAPSIDNSLGNINRLRARGI